jgi:hypothetical protein
MRENSSGAQSSETRDEIQDGEFEPIYTLIVAEFSLNVADTFMNK